MSVQNWRDTARVPKLFIFDARLLIPLSVFLLHIRAWTFWVAVIFTLLFFLLERKGYTISVILKMARIKTIGRYRPVVDSTLWKKRTRW